ncbi:hypothetical protein Ddc_22903 [Ditylenchus destructor]|nr:hypothetical protein Ddc_22903 [Ditylenchus destructor]
MVALLDPTYVVRLPMTKPETATLTLRIDAALLGKLEAGAAASNLSLDQHVEWLIEEAVFINSPEFFDPDNEEARDYRLVRESQESLARGRGLPLKDVLEELAGRGGDRSAADAQASAPSKLTLTINAEMMERLRKSPIALHFSVEEYALRLMNEALFINSPEFFDPNSWRAYEYRLVREGIRSGMLEPTVSLEEVEREFRERFAAARSKDQPSKP